MPAVRRTRWVLTVALLALVALGSLAASDAHLTIVWRASVVSWDNPATQLQDALATQGAVYVDDRQVGDPLGGILVAAGGVVSAGAPRRDCAVPASARLTRSPPLPV